MARKPLRAKPLPDVSQIVAMPEKPKSRARAYREAADYFRPRTNNVSPFIDARGGPALPLPFPGVLPKGSNGSPIAMDYDGDVRDAMAFANAQAYSGGEGLAFLGYAYLAELAQRAEYRLFSEIIAEEMTRKFMRIVSASKEDQSTRIRLINDAIDKFKVKEVLRQVAMVDGLYGRANLYIDLGPTTDEVHASPLILDKAIVPLHSLRGFKVVEPYWTYPNEYNTTDPTDDWFYKPRSWFCMGKKYHTSRFLPFIGRELPDLLKPAYAFGGLSQSQLAKPYVDNWIRTRQNVADLIEAFSVWVLKTDLDSTLSKGSGEALEARLALFNLIKSTRGIMALNGNDEDLTNISAPLGTLDHLQAQAQEHMCSVGRIPLVKFTGITPSGLNASSDGEIRAFFDTIAGQQVRLFGPHMKTILDLIMLSELGEINKDISYAWEPLWQMSETERSGIRNTNANTAKTYIDAGIIAPEEERERLAVEEDGLYQGLDPNDLPQPPDNNMGIDPVTGEPLVPGENDMQPNDNPQDAVAQDDFAGGAWAETKHPRDRLGEFAKKGAGSVASSKLDSGVTRGNSEWHAKAVATKIFEGKRVNADGSALPEHIAKLKLPPAWSDVKYSNDPASHLQAQGRDAKGRVQSVYSETFSKTQAAAKFDRIEKLREQYDTIKRQNDTARQSSDPKKRDAADCLALIMEMGVRPGSEEDTGADKKAFGATTLQGKHVVSNSRGSFLRFTGKKGVDLNLPITDPSLIEMLKARAAKAESSGQIFPNVNDKALLEHTHSLGDGSFKTKDFRTYLGTTLANETIKGVKPPTNLKEWKQAVKQVGTKVAEKLGNTPTVAIASYINPSVWSVWGEVPKK